MRSSLDAWFTPAPDPARVEWLKSSIFAHRGLHSAEAVENSPTAFARAIEAGLGIECDVQATADDRAAVFHDFDLERLTGSAGPLATHTLAELEQIALSGTTDTISSLAALLQLVAGRVPLLVEIKTRRSLPVAPLCHAVRHDLEGYPGPHAVMSFDPRICRWFRLHSPQTLRGLVVSESEGSALRRRLALWHGAPQFLACDIRDLPSRFAEGQRARGLPLLTWTVRNAGQLETATRCSASVIVEHGGVAAAAMGR